MADYLCARPRGMIGRRGATLLFLALLDVVYAYGLAFPTPRSAQNPTTVFLAAVMPLWAWAGIWLGVGLLCLVGAFWKRPDTLPFWKRPEMLAFYAALGLKLFFALTFLGGELTGQVERGYISAVIWGAFAGFVGVLAGWRENHRVLIELSEGGDDGE